MAAADDRSEQQRPALPWNQRFARALRYVMSGAEGGGLTSQLDAVFADDGTGLPAMSPAERDMFLNLLGFNELRVEDVMVPRADIVAVEEGVGFDDLVAAFSDANHSRLPVYRETLDDPRGMVHIKDLMGWMAKGRDDAARAGFSAASIRRDVLFVPPSMPAIDLLLKMQTSHVHMALVIDEYGGTDGLVTIEDLVEEIVGDIEDEHDEAEEAELVKRADGLIEAAARAPIEDLEEMTGLELVTEDREDEIDTLGGLVVDMLDRLPQRGEVVVHPCGLEFEVIDADARRIKRLLIHPGTAYAEDKDGEGAEAAHTGEETTTPQSAARNG